MRKLGYLLVALGLLYLLSMTVLMRNVLGPPRGTLPEGIGEEDRYAFLVAGFDRGTYFSSSGSRSVRVVVHDAGATHSGDHFAWVIQETGPTLSRPRMIGNGYLQSSSDPIILEWKNEKTFSVLLYNSKDTDGERTKPIVMKLE